MTRVLVVNAGSSTLKVGVVDREDAIDDELRVDPWDGTNAELAIGTLLDRVAPVDAIAHRVVHGGSELTATTVVTPAVESRIERLVPLAPLHQPRALDAMRAARSIAPETPQVACFDTAFHATMPAAARTYPLPAKWRRRWDLRRFGFHGLSHAWTSRRAPSVAGSDRPEPRVVSCHLGAGASLCAVSDGRSIDTTMGFTPLDGLVMATRAGAVDPGLLLWLLTDAGLDLVTLEEGLQRHSGLEGLSGVGGDMRAVLAARGAGDPDASLAFDVYVHRLRREVAAMTAALGGLDVLAFTGGVGERAAPVRAACVDGLAYLGVGIDAVANDAATGDADISAADADAQVVVVTSREDLEMAAEARRTLQ